jgi:membrane protease YdiL (CAAX protease family)
LTARAEAALRARRFLRPAALIVGFYLITLVTLGVLQALTSQLHWVSIGNQDVWVGWLSLASGVLATWIMLRLVEKRSWSTLGLGRAATSPALIVKGLVLGGLTIGVASLLLLSTHMLRVVPSVKGSWWGEAGHSTASLLPAAFFEELFFRGYAFAVLRRAAGWRLALIVTSVVFGFLHAWNPGADAEAVLAVIVAGFFLGAILLFTRSLYAAGAAHFAWNWVMAGALHIAVSGIPSRNPDYKVIETGPDWLTGGRWGPEGGAAAVAAMFVVVFYLYGRHQRRGEWNWGQA